MKDRVVLITGAKGGLGSFVTQRFLTTGARVVGTSRSISKEDFPEPNFAPLPVDFTKPAADREAVETVVSRYGKLDVLVHVLGRSAGGKLVAESDGAAWVQPRDADFTPASHVLRAVIPNPRK